MIEKEQEMKNEGNFFSNVDWNDVTCTMETLLKNGVHFGHHKSKKNPAMDEFIFTTRNNINIIDLAKTVNQIKKIQEFIKEIKGQGKKILFVGTKKQAIRTVKEAAEFIEMPYVIERWLGGTFTNFKVIRGRSKYLLDLEDKKEKGELKKYTKFEQVKKDEEITRMNKRMGGIKSMDELPGVIVVTDLKKDAIAVREAKIAGVPIIAIVDTNTDPTEIEYPIAANDDAVSSLRIILAILIKEYRQ